MNRRAWLALVLVATIAPVDAQGPLTIVAPAAPGGGWDQTARVMQHVLAIIEPDIHTQVENVPGAAGTIGLARFVSGERGNPHALLVTGLVMVSGITMNQSAVTLNDVTPIARLTGEYEVVVVPASSPIGTLRDLLDMFKTAPASVAWAGGSAGGTDDLLVRLIAEAVNVPPSYANYIAFPGGGAALAALLGGQVTAGVSGYGEFAGQIESGALRLLAVSSVSRVDGIDAPTLREQGIDVYLANWRGLVAPPGLTAIERDALTSRVERLATSEEWGAALERNGWSDLLLTGAPFRQFLLAEQHRVDAVLRRLQSDARRNGPALRVTPATLPTAAAGALLLLLLTMVWSRSKSGRPFHTAHRGSLRPLVLLGALGVHAIALPTIGFIPASAALFAVTATLIGSSRRVRDVLIGLTLAILLHLVFTVGLGLSLPADPITRWVTG